MAQQEMKFTIIVPVYNVENYLKECVESLINQTYKPYEIILVDDGSTDNSGKICDEYSKAYTYIKTFHKMNGGLSDARNFGIDKVSGEYMLFVDSDDYIDLNTLDTYYKTCVHNGYPDIMIDQSNYEFFEGKIKCSNTAYDYTDFGIKNGKEAFKKLVSTAPLWSPCAKCYKVEYWKKYDFHFTQGIYAEDLDLTYKVIFLSETVVMTPSMYYYRYKREGSITNSINKKKIEDIFHILDSWNDFFEKYSVDENDRNNMYRYFGELIVYLIMGNIYYLDKTERYDIYIMIEKYLYALKQYNSLLGKVTNMSVRIIGIKATSFFVFYMKKVCLKFMRK